jgi:hypothetical protein
MLQDYTFADLGNTNTSPPLSEVAAYFRQRVWVYDDDLLYYSTPYPADYSAAFDRTTNNYRVNAGLGRAIIPIRDTGLVVLGQDSVWGINPSVTPAATDKPEKLLEIGCVAGKTAVMVGDDVYYLAPDGVRGLFRTQQDKLQGGASYPLSYALKDEFDSLSWNYISKASAVYFDNKYFISVPVDSSAYNNEVWVYYPASGGWTIITGWSVADWAKLKVNGQELLYYIDSNDGSVYRAWTGYSDNGTAINYLEEGRREDLSQPLVTKSGGELKVRAKSSGNYNLSVSANADEGGYTLLGLMNLTGNTVTLPVTLDFVLSNPNIVEESFHLDGLGSWKNIQIKIQHNDTNGTDDIKVYERSVITFADEYQSE